MSSNPTASNGANGSHYAGAGALEYSNASIAEGGHEDAGGGYAGGYDDDDDLDDSFDMLADVPDTPGQPERLHGGGDINGEGDNVDNRSPSQSQEDKICLSDILGIQDSPDPADAASPPPAASALSQGLRRSPRLASAARRGSMAGGHYGGLPKSGKKGRARDVEGGSGGGEGGEGSSGLTPYSSRRGRRQSQGFAAFTPGTANGESGMEEGNASFR